MGGNSWCEYGREADTQVVQGVDRQQHAVTSGPAALSIHAVLALLLILAAIGLLVQAVMARYWTVLAAAVIALIAIVGAAISGANFTNTGQARRLH